MTNTNKLEAYKMTRTQNMPNLKECIGEVVVVVAMQEHEYTDPAGEVHVVMALKFADGRYYRTEVGAFREAFKDFWEYFSEEENKPEIMITGKTSKRGNDYVNFDVVG